MQTKRPDGLNHPDAHPPSAPAGGGPEGAEAPAETRNHIQSAPEGSSAAGGAAKSRPQDCNRIRRLCRRGGSFSDSRKTFLTASSGREPRSGDQREAANSSKWRSHFEEGASQKVWSMD